MGPIGVVLGVDVWFGFGEDCCDLRRGQGLGAIGVDVGRFALALAGVVRRGVRVLVAGGATRDRLCVVCQVTVVGLAAGDPFGAQLLAFGVGDPGEVLPRADPLDLAAGQVVLQHDPR
ncbi:hypothetical protein [Nonomuraea diastatica]|uniref:Uncharacterized protein n=1 Tax=Nonomuraea diastatica TaxID=1848329 RepID=A0A4R4VNB8_9ACTN|nr:hypothetical protein [Nonomuraea diastatica]TDD06571.1 hypothetical protein E1294_48815 [Nonomuraea diastatica]